MSPPDTHIRVAVLFDNFGPYHLARLRAASKTCDLLAIEVAGRSAEYLWARHRDELGFRSMTLFPASTRRAARLGQLMLKLRRALADFQPEVLCIPGWSSLAALVALGVAHRQGIPVVMMSESGAGDRRRSAWTEWLKRRLVGRCSAGLVGGRRHAEYLCDLGMSAERVFLGYDVVDNSYFHQCALQVRMQAPELRRQYNLPENYFLASARFVTEKNLFRLLESYSLYRKEARQRHASGAWDLVLLGEGRLRPALEQQSARLELGEQVHMPGFQQYEQLPVYYGLAGAFVHASTSEPWGLVVNEAMASGLPVLVSERCGCAAELMEEGGNGFSFAPEDMNQIAGLLGRVAEMSEAQRSQLGGRSWELVSAWSPERFAAGLKAAARKALESGSARKSAGEMNRNGPRGLLQRI